MLAAKIAQTLPGLDPGTSVFVGRRFIHKATDHGTIEKIKLRNMFGFVRSLILLAARIAQTLPGVEPGTSVFIGRRFIHKANLPCKN